MRFSHTSMVRERMLRFGFAVISVSLLLQLGAASTATSSAQGVLRRTIGSAASNFILSDLPSEKGFDVYEVEAKQGKVTVAGSSAVAIARGAYDYIRNVCKRQITWGRMKVELPKLLPDYSRARVVCPNKYRHYFNVCTFGYSTVWWDWRRWEEEIDWMALHGINMPLAMNGQEAIWEKVWRKQGLTDTQIRSYFAGPAFLPWHRMGNINSHGGPLPQSWIDEQADLQKQILGREREMGMTPVTPAFSGFVPPAFRQSHPNAQIIESSAWAGFDPTLLLNPRDPLYLQIGKDFVEEYRKEFGSDHLYLADVYNEMTPRLPVATKLDDLKATGDSVYKAILAGDPQGTWVMQGWLFYNDRSFWGEKETDAFLSAVPDDRMIIIDLACDSMEIWRAQPAVRKKQWIYCTLHNFGETTALFGDLAEFAKRPIRALKDPDHGQMSGMGITPEGIEQNPVVYELATDTMWRREPIDLPLWIHDYAEARYGVCPPGVDQAWQILLHKVYDGSYPPSESRIEIRPSVDFGGEPSAAAEDIGKSTKLLLEASREIGPNHLFEQDIVDLLKRYLEEVAGAYWLQGLIDRDSSKPEGFTLQTARFFKVLDDLDRLLGTIPEYRLSTWIDNARRWGKNRAEQNQMEQNAKMQVTVWGGPDLHDYAWKEWSGLVANFYKQRWIRMFRIMLESTGKPINGVEWNRSIAEWELGWTREIGFHNEDVAPSRLGSDNPSNASSGGTVRLAKQLIDRYPLPKFEAGEPGIAVGKPVSVSGGTEGSHKPEYAVDGKTSGEYWSASPYPQWLQIDLEKPEVINRIQVFTYHDGERYYQYTIEVSTDGKTWKQMVDMSKNSTLASIRGTTHTFDPISARYVRVNMLFNSANVGVHLTEVKIFRVP